MSRVEELKRVGNLTMSDLVQLGKVAIGPGFGARMREAINEQTGQGAPESGPNRKRSNGNGSNGSNGHGPPSVILVADDDADILALLRLVLEEDGHEVIEAADGEEAAMLTLERRPDLCVLDAGMNGIDGLKVTRLLRAADQTREVPIVLTSTRPQPKDAERARELGADDYVTKPFIPDDLQRSVGRLLARRPTGS